MALSIALVAGTAMAGNIGPYVYGGLGYSNADVDLEEMNYATDAGSLKLEKDEDSVAVKLAAGYRFNQYFAAEVAYTYLGKAEATLNVATKEGDVSANAKASLQGHMISADALAIYPVTKDIEVFAKGGLGIARTKTKYSGSAFLYGDEYSEGFSKSKTRVVPKLGVGVEFAVAKNVSVRAEYEHLFNVSKESDYTVDADYNLFNVGVRYAFWSTSF